MNWLLAAHRSELAKRGDYIVLSAGTSQIAAFNLDGEVLATDNLCAHRGARILPGTHGNRELKCGYHGMSGKTIVWHQYLTQWIGDFLFVGDGSSKIEDDLDDLGPLLSGISTRISARHSFENLPMSCDWRVAVENTLEDFHIPSIHPDTFGKLDLKIESMERHGRNSGAIYKVGDERRVKGLQALAKYFDDVQPDHYFHIYLYPYACLSSVGGFTFSLQHYMPSGGFTAFHTRLYAGKTNGTAPNLSWFYEEAAAFNRLVFQQDMGVCSTVGGSGTFLTPDERRVEWFRAAGK